MPLFIPYSTYILLILFACFLSHPRSVSILEPSQTPAAGQNDSFTSPPGNETSPEGTMEVVPKLSRSYCECVKILLTKKSRSLRDHSLQKTL